MVLNVEHRHMTAALGRLQCSHLYLYLMEQLGRAEQYTELCPVCKLPCPEMHS